jgi:hypothetical protein
MNEHIAALRDLGYTAYEAWEGALRITGFGIDLYLDAADSDALASLADADAHAARLDQYENGAPPPPPVEVLSPPPDVVALAAAIAAAPELSAETKASLIAALRGSST